MVAKPRVILPCLGQVLIVSNQQHSRWLSCTCSFQGPRVLQDYLPLKQFAKDVGAPEVLVCDSHPTQKKRDVKEFCVQIGTTLRVLEAETQWANRAELYVGLLKKLPARICGQRDLPLSSGTIAWRDVP